MYKDVYIEKANELLLDTSTYEIIKRNKTLLKKLQNSCSQILKRWNNCDYLDRSYHNNDLTMTDTVMSKFYGLP